MTVLIDTSVWIVFFRARGDPGVKSRVADLLALGAAAYTCPVRYELVLGAKPNERADLDEGLGFAQRLMATTAHWDRAAELASGLRAQGLSFPALDVLIAVVAEGQGIPLFSRDGHFVAIRDHALPALHLY